MPTRRDDAARRLRPVFLGATALLLLLLAVFAYALAHSQSQQRKDIDKRFTDRAEVAAAVNESIFTLASNQQRGADASQFSGPKVDSAALQTRLTQNQQPYALVTDAQGKVLAHAGSVPSAPARQARIAKAAKSGRTEYSGIFAAGGKQLIEGVSPFQTKYGLRFDIGGSSADLIGQFLSGFLVKLPTVAHAKSYVVDEMGKVIATPGAKSSAGVSLSDKALASALGKAPHGSYDGNRYFTSDAIAGTPWRIVLSASKSDLYSSVETTVPWIIFIAFVLVSAGGLFLVRRVLLANAQLERADISRQHALEINDNVVQRLVLAKYALDRGATETSQQKLSETLRETQQLVTSMLEEKEIGPGSLRRAAPAGTEGPPEPPPPSWQRKND
jgi:hypothetical protein